MAYITVALVTGRWPGLKSAVDGSRITSAAVQQWIDEAGGIIDSYLARRYTLPLSATPPIISAVAYDLFEYRWLHQSYNPISGDAEVIRVEGLWRRSIKILEDIISAAIPLITSAGVVIQPSVSASSLIRINHADNDAIFSMKDSWEQKVPDNYGDSDNY